MKMNVTHGVFIPWHFNLFCFCLFQVTQNMVDSVPCFETLPIILHVIAFSARPR